MKRFRIIGKSNQMRTIFLRDRETGKFVQHKITRGKTIEVMEDELTFHVERQKGFKIIDVEEIPEPETPVVEETVETSETTPQKKTRGRRRKAVVEPTEIVDEIEEIPTEYEGL